MALEKEIGEKAKEGAFWGTSGAFLQEGLLLIFGMIMARFISEEEFGLFSTVNIYTNLGSIILQLGLPVALIQRKNLTGDHIKTAYTTMLGMGLGLALLLSTVSPWIASAYGKPQLMSVVIVASLIFIFNAAYGIPNALLTRAFRFKRSTILSFIAVLVSGTVALVMAVKGFGVWSLVASSVGFPAVFCIPAIWLCGWRPRLGFAPRAWADLAPLGITVMASNLIALLSQNADQLVIGGTLGFGLFGYYSRAYGLIILPLQKVSTLVEYVAFPAYSKIQDQTELVQVVYLKASLILALITYPMITGLAIIAPEFLRIFYGPHWVGAALPMRILGLATLIMMVHMTAGAVLVALGQARAQLACQSVRLVLMAVVAALGSRWGLAGVCWAVCVGNVLYLAVVQSYATRLVKVSFARVLYNLLPPIVLTVIMAAAVWLCRLGMQLYVSANPAIALAVSLLVGVATYIAAIRILPFREVQELFSEFTDQIKGKWDRLTKAT